MILYTCMAITQGFNKDGNATSPMLGAAFFAENAKDACLQALSFMYEEGVPSHLLGVRVTHVQKTDKSSLVTLQEAKTKLQQIAGEEREVHLFFDRNEIEEMADELLLLQKENTMFFATVNVIDPAYTSVPIFAPNAEIAAKKLFSSYINIRPMSNVTSLSLVEERSKQSHSFPLVSKDPNETTLVSLLEQDMNPTKAV